MQFRASFPENINVVQTGVLTGRASSLELGKGLFDVRRDYSERTAATARISPPTQIPQPTTSDEHNSRCRTMSFFSEPCHAMNDTMTEGEKNAVESKTELLYHKRSVNIEHGPSPERSYPYQRHRADVFDRRYYPSCDVVAYVVWYIIALSFPPY